MKPTIKDVALLAGVSKSTVSQFLNKRYSYMSENTRKKIEAAIKELNYYPNQIAKSLKQKSTNVIVFVCATLSSRFSLELIGAVEAYFGKEDYAVIVASSDDNPKHERELIESFIAKQVDGILVFPTAENKDFYTELQARKVPLVFIDRLIPGVEIPSVLLDNVSAGYLATQELIDYGHKDIAIFTFPLGEQITTRFERIAGYKKALSDNQLAVNPAYIVSCSKLEIEDRLTALFAQEDAPTALLTTNDMLLEAALVWVKKEKIKIPERFSLISIDEVTFAKLFDPEITVLAQPVMKIGTKAAELLLTQIKGGGYEDSVVYRYEPQLIKRNSIKNRK